VEPALAAGGESRELGTRYERQPRNEYVTTNVFRFDAAGKLVEHWDAVREVPSETKNGNSMY
jgi:predicted SnoaL-like aldol condensation-catalyzing enzyme